MAQVIRLSPSGPPLRGDSGSMAEPGTGFQLRLDEAAGSTTMGELTTTFQAITGSPQNSEDSGVYEVKLDNPSPAKRYKVNCHFEVDNFSTGEGSQNTSIQVRLRVSYDGGTTRETLGENAWQLDAGNQIRAGVDLAMALGSEMVPPVPAAAPEISVIMEVSAAHNNATQIPNGGLSGTIWLSLAELL